MSQRPHVVIVGGGLAGMAAALALSETELRVTLIEARGTTGGRAGSFTDPVSGSEIDYCQHVAMGCCTNLLDLLQRSGQLQDWRRYRELTFVGPGGERCSFAASQWLPAPFHFLRAFAGLSYLSPKIQRLVSRGIWKLMRLPQSELTRWSDMRRWLTEAGQSDEAISQFWDVILVSALGEATDRVAVAPARKVLVDGFLGHRDAADVWVPQQPLSVLFGRRLPETLIRRGVDVQVSKRVTGVDCRDGRATSLQLADGATICLDYLIVATAWHQLLRTLGAAMPAVDHCEAIASMSVSPITGIHLWCDRPLTDSDHLIFVGRLSQWIFRPAYAKDQPGRFYHQVVVSASREIPGRDQLVKLIMDELRELLPGARDACLVDSRIVTDPKSVFSASVETEQQRPAANTNLQNMWLAGDWTATQWPATMESAVISGYHAADLVGIQIGAEGKFEQPPLRRGGLAGLLIR